MGQRKRHTGSFEVERTTGSHEVLDRLFVYGTMRAGQTARSLVANSIKKTAAAHTSGTKSHSARAARMKPPIGMASGLNTSMMAAPVVIAGQPSAQGLYDPAHEHDACGVGFVVNIKGVRSHAIVRQALQVLINLLHRGACGCEANTGDGAGILLQMPDKFLRKQCGRLGIPLPGPKDYGAGLVFLPRNLVQREKVQGLIATIVAEEGQRLLGWRVTTLLGSLATCTLAGAVALGVGRVLAPYARGWPASLGICVAIMLAGGLTAVLVQGRAQRKA